MFYSPLPLGLVDPQDLKPENLLFLTEAEDANIMIADFGLSRVMDQEKHNKLTEICGTPGASFYLFRLHLYSHFTRLISIWPPRFSKRVRNAFSLIPCLPSLNF